MIFYDTDQQTLVYHQVCTRPALGFHSQVAGWMWAGVAGFVCDMCWA